MKLLTGTSAIILMLSVGSLESAGAWWLLPLAAGAGSLALLFFACSRLGCFDRAHPATDDRHDSCDVVWLHERRVHPRCGEGSGMADRPAVSYRSSSMKSTVQSSRSM